MILSPKALIINQMLKSSITKRANNVLVNDNLSMFLSFIWLLLVFTLLNMLLKLQVTILLTSYNQKPEGSTNVSKTLFKVFTFQVTFINNFIKSILLTLKVIQYRKRFEKSPFHKKS